jgi:hypothetical protein
MVWAVWRRRKSLAPSENGTTIPWLTIPSLYIARTSRLQCWRRSSSSCWFCPGRRAKNSELWNRPGSWQSTFSFSRAEQVKVAETFLPWGNPYWPTSPHRAFALWVTNTSHFHRVLCDILVACPCVRYGHELFKSNTGIIHTTDVIQLPLMLWYLQTQTTFAAYIPLFEYRHTRALTQLWRFNSKH